MPEAIKKRGSLLLLLGGVMSFIIIAVSSTHIVHHYFMQKQRLTEAVRLEMSHSLTALQHNIAPFIEAFAANEYAKLLTTEIRLRHYDAIIVEDFSMGEILGQHTYVTGVLLNPEGDITQISSIDVALQQRLDQTFFRASAAIHSPAGALIGNVTIYVSDAALQRELQRALLVNLIETLVIVVLVIIFILAATHRLLILPLRRISSTIAQCDSDGIPIHPVPAFNYAETAALTDTMNTMLAVIRQSRDTLQQERRRLQDILEGTHVGTWEWNVQSGEVTCNERWAEIVGYTLAELQPISIATWMQLTHPDDFARSGAQLEQHFSGELPFYECEVRMRHKEGMWVWVLDRGRVATLTAKGKPLLMSGTHQDITARKMAEVALIEAKQAADVANHAKSRFLATMSHEIRTPMSGVLGMAELLEQSELSDDQRQQVETIIASGSALLGVINDILDYSKVSSGHMTLEQHPFNLQQLGQECIDLLQQMANNSGLKLEFVSNLTDTNCSPIVIGDSTRLRQVILNLLGNALKFTEKGEVQLQLECRPFDAAHVQIRVAVKDSGIGIPPGEQERLFDAFTQADMATTRKYGGTGLGLSITRSLVRLMGGEVFVESALGQGSLFYFTLLLSRGTVTGEARDSEQQVPLQGHILLVDDSPVNRLVAKAFLGKMGLSAVEAMDGQEALEAWRSGHYDLVLMDCRMPAMDGYEATQKIRAEEGEQHIPIIAITANTAAEDRELCLTSGMDEVITKPFSQVDLYTVLRQFLAKKEQSDDTYPKA
ncbi:MAG: response regulator [Gammaproteobacteria bacterium]|nr:response regulator [Gammaproteobacteria bacterium]